MSDWASKQALLTVQNWPNVMALNPKTFLWRGQIKKNEKKLFDKRILLMNK